MVLEESAREAAASEKKPQNPFKKYRALGRTGEKMSSSEVNEFVFLFFFLRRKVVCQEVTPNFAV